MSFMIHFIAFFLYIMKYLTDILGYHHSVFILLLQYMFGMKKYEYNKEKREGERICLKGW